jgi:hypothetical protein
MNTEQDVRIERCSPTYLEPYEVQRVERSSNTGQTGQTVVPYTTHEEPGSPCKLPPQQPYESNVS